MNLARGCLGFGLLDPETPEQRDRREARRAAERQRTAHELADALERFDRFLFTDRAVLIELGYFLMDDPGVQGAIHENCD